MRDILFCFPDAHGHVQLLKRDDVRNWETSVVVSMGMSLIGSALEYLVPSRWLLFGEV